MLFVSCIKSKAKSIEGTYVVGVRIENSSGMSVGGNVNSDNCDCYVDIQKVKSNKVSVIAYIEDSLIFNQELELKKDTLLVMEKLLRICAKRLLYN